MFLLLRKRDRGALECATESYWPCGISAARGPGEFGSRGNRVTRMGPRSRWASGLQPPQAAVLRSSRSRRWREV